MSATSDLFKPRVSVEQVEEGRELAPKFDSNGHIPVVTTDFASGELLMHAYMNAEALAKQVDRTRRGGLLEPKPPAAVAQRRNKRSRPKGG